MSLTVALQDKDRLIDAATTSLASKVGGFDCYFHGVLVSDLDHCAPVLAQVVSQSSTNLAPLAVEAVLKVTDAEKDINVDLNKVRVRDCFSLSRLPLSRRRWQVTKALGGTVDETELVDGLVFTRKASHVAGAPTKKTDAKVGLIQFHLSAPKTDVEGTVVVSEYTDMDRILREERKYILGLCKKIAKTGCNVLLVQKSILRDAVTDQSLHFLAKLGIMVVRDVERDDVEFIAKVLIVLCSQRSYALTHRPCLLLLHLGLVLCFPIVRPLAAHLCHTSITSLLINLGMRLCARRFQSVLVPRLLR